MLKAQPNELEVGRAAREVVDADHTHGADLGSGAAAKACYEDSGDHIIDLGSLSCAGSLGADRLRAGGQLLLRQEQHRQRLLDRWGLWG
jgi:hypothetical protein